MYSKRSTEPDAKFFMLGKIASIARGFVWGILLQTYGFHLVMRKCERLEGMHFIDAHNFTTIMLERHAL